MQEDTESFNENSNSEVIILPQNSHLEETLISDDEETDNETTHSYDAKLDAKLKDFGLYEDGMTIQQKEELLAVVEVSFKTAEEEKTRRQWYEEYANAALAFPEDEIEFCFQQSPESELSTKASCYPGDYEENTFKSKRSSNADMGGKNMEKISASSRTSNSEEYQNLPSTSQNSSYKAKSHSRKNRVRGGNSSYKLSLDEGNTVTSHSSFPDFSTKDALLLINKQKKLLLEKSISSWRPCLSPKDEPLLCARRLIPDETVGSPELKTNRNIPDYNQEFNFALTEIKKTIKNAPYFGKPYYLTRSGHCIKKSIKLDALDIMVGVQEKSETTSEPSVPSFSAVRKEPFSRTSRGAFRYAQSHRDRIDALRASSSSIVNIATSSTATCSSSKYNAQKQLNDCRTFPEVVVEDDLEPANIPLPLNFDSSVSGSASHPINTSEHLDSDEGIKNAINTKLPKFSNLRPDLCRDTLPGKNSMVRQAALTFNSLNCTDRNEVHGKENHIGSSFQDGELSDSSSVIDVETIVDDEIEEFVLKRKLFQEPTVSDRQTYSNRPKRLKRKP